MNTSCKSLIIKNNKVSIFGILRGKDENENLLILLPAPSGSRIGPQRIFTEIAQGLIENNVTTFCADLPPFGDSSDFDSMNVAGSYSQKLNSLYAKYLDIIINYFKSDSNYNNIILLSISDGCMPVLNYIIKNSISQAILLSPNSLLNQPGRVHINKKNVRSYIYKLLNIHTYIKLISFRLNFLKIFANIFSFSIRKKKTGSTEYGSVQKILNKPKILCVFGEKDADLQQYLNFWKSNRFNDILESYEEKIIPNADHSYFGWIFKKEVVATVSNWLNK